MTNYDEELAWQQLEQKQIAKVLKILAATAQAISDTIQLDPKADKSLLYQNIQHFQQQLRLLDTYDYFKR